jgi:hypothetical protein
MSEYVSTTSCRMPRDAARCLEMPQHTVRCREMTCPDALSFTNKISSYKILSEHHLQGVCFAAKIFQKLLTNKIKSLILVEFINSSFFLFYFLQILYYIINTRYQTKLPALVPIVPHPLPPISYSNFMSIVDPQQIT